MHKVQFNEWFGKVTYGSMDAIEIVYDNGDGIVFTTFVVDNDKNEIAVCTKDSYDQIVDISADKINIHNAILNQSTYLLPDYEDEKRVHAIKMKMIGEVQEPHFQEVYIYSKEELKDAIMETMYNNLNEDHLIYNEVISDKVKKPFTPRFTIPYLRHLNSGKSMLDFEVPKFGYLMDILVGREEYKFIDFICELTYMVGYTISTKAEINKVSNEIRELSQKISKLKNKIREGNRNIAKVLGNKDA